MTFQECFYKTLFYEITTVQIYEEIYWIFYLNHIFTYNMNDSILNTEYLFNYYPLKVIQQLLLGYLQILPISNKL